MESLSVGKTTESIPVLDEVKRFEVRAGQFKDVLAASPLNRKSKKARARSQIYAARVLPKTSRRILLQRKSLINASQKPIICSRLPLDLPLSLAAKHVDDESYWKRECVEVETKWTPHTIRKRGCTWKQYFWKEIWRMFWNPSTRPEIPRNYFR